LHLRASAGEDLWSGKHETLTALDLLGKSYGAHLPWRSVPGSVGRIARSLRVTWHF